MATTEEIIGRTKDGRLLVYWANAGPSSYPTGGFQVSITNLRRVERSVSISSNGGYLCECASVSGNSLTVLVRYFDYDATSDGAAIQVPNATNLSTVTFSGVVVGY